MKNHFLLMVLLGATLHAQQYAEPKSEPRLKFAPTAGFGYRLGMLSEEIPPDFEAYARNLKTGYSLGIDGTYFVKPQWGLGIKYLRFGSSNSIGNVQVTFGDGNSARGRIADIVTIDFIGAAYSSITPLGNGKHLLIGNLALGYLAYVNESLLVNRSVRITGNTFGAALDFGYDYKISKRIRFGAQLGYALGTLNKVAVLENENLSNITFEDENRENLAFLTLGGGFRLSI